MLFKNTSSQLSITQFSTFLRRLANYIFASLFVHLVARLVLTRKLRRVRIHNLKFIVLPKVFDFLTGLSSLYMLQELIFLARRLVRKAHRHIVKMLETCAGSGFIGICIGSVIQNSYLLLVDVDFKCAKNAYMNAKINRLDSRADVVVSNLVDCIRRRSFDIAIANPPYLPCPHDRYPALCCGYGCWLVLTLIRDILKVLKPDGTMLFTLSSLSGVELGPKFRIIREVQLFPDRVLICGLGFVTD